MTTATPNPALSTSRRVRRIAIGLLSGAAVATGLLMAPAASNATTSYQTQVINLINQQRTAHGCGKLTYNANLAAAAQGHSADMAKYNYFSHTGHNGSSPDARIRAAGYKPKLWGENIAAGYSTPSSVVNAWMNSSGHRANILNCKFHETGVGYATSSSSTYHYYWTQDFGTR